MKKIITLIILVMGIVGQANAISVSLKGSFDNWSGTSSLSSSTNEWLFKLEGSCIHSGAMEFKLYIDNSYWRGAYGSDTHTFTTTNGSVYYDSHTEGSNFILSQNANAKSIYIYVKQLDNYSENNNSFTNFRVIPLVTEDNLDSYTISFSSNWSSAYAYVYYNLVPLCVFWPGTVISTSTGNGEITLSALSGSKVIFNDNNNYQTDSSGFDLISGSYSNEGLTNITATITSVGYATFSSTKALDFTSETTIEACKATVGSDGKISYTAVTSVAANEGVLLRRKDGSLASASSSIPLHSNQSVSANVNNDFKAITTKQLLSQTADSKTNYILTNKKSDGTTGALGFYKVNASGSWCAAGTAYLATTYSSPSRGYFPVWEDATSVENIANMAENVNLPVFDLQGRRVNNPQKGLYIINGKKVIR